MTPRSPLRHFDTTFIGRALAEALSRAGVAPDQVEEVILGNVLQAGLGQNPARQAALAAGIPDTVGAFTINKVCGSGLKSVMLAAQAIRAGDADVIVAGGMESMTNSPYLVPQARAGARLGHAQMIDSMVWDGLWDIHNDFHMGLTAEKVAEKYDVSRAAQDQFAVESHRRAAEATAKGLFDAEKFTVEVKGRKGAVTQFTTDETIRADSSTEGLAKLRAAFKKDGTVTAANASSINDGASALVVLLLPASTATQPMSWQRKCRALVRSPRRRHVSTTSDCTTGVRTSSTPPTLMRRSTSLPLTQR